MRSLWESICWFPVDLTLVIITTVLTVGVVIQPGVLTPLRILLGILFVLFLPGYTLVASLFPFNDSSRIKSNSRSYDMENRLTNLERFILSFGSSIAIVPLIGLILNFTPWGFQFLPMLFSLSSFIVVTAILGAIHRHKLPAENQFTVPYQKWFAVEPRDILNRSSRINIILNILVVLSLLLAISSVGYMLTVPSEDEQFSEFYLLTENDDDQLVADNYPQEFVVGESQELVFAISNYEYEPTQYTVVVVLEEVEFSEGTEIIHNRDYLDIYRTDELAHEEDQRFEHEIEPTRSGENLRLAYLLYKGDPPEQPTITNSYREIHLWIDVEQETEEVVYIP